MSRRLPVPALAIAMVVVTLAEAIGGSAISAANTGRLDPTAAIGIIGFLSFPAMGLLILHRDRRHLIGWLLLAVGVNVYVIFGSADYAEFALRHPGSIPFGEAVAWISGWGWIPFVLMILLLIPMFFPDGRLLSSRWVVALFSGLIFAAFAFLGNAFSPGPVSTTYPELTNPITIPAWQPFLRNLVDFAVPFGLVALGGSLASVIIRYRRAGSLQRRQLRWFLFAVVVAAVPFILNGAIPAVVDDLLVVVLVPLLPISIAIAVLRYRLYDIDVVINRTLVYGALAAFITAVYVGVVVGIGTLVGSGSRPNLALSIVATAIVAVAFQPVRESVQRFANRLVYGERATPYEVMAGFADRMAGTLSADEVLPQMAEAAARGVGAQAARVTLILPGGTKRSTVWPPNSSGDQFARTLPVSYRDEPVGEIAVREGPGQPITPGEGRLLADLAAQAGLVLHNVRLTAELQARLADLSAQAAELRASRQRILTAQDSERRRLGGEIRAGVQRELEATSAQLDDVERLLVDDATAAAARLEALTGETQQTLDSLRELARGIFPPLLADRGIGPALEAQTRKAIIPASILVDSSVAGARFDPGVEAAVYFCCVEALRGAAAPATVHLSAQDGALTFAVDGAAALGGRLQGLRDRVEALGGGLEAEGSDRLHGWIPTRALAEVG